ncbi:hypothetical protein GALMADRAFT_243667 [Galerina marginata CBS 339.88]|uniref:F-box domain-containing protein n=1 Tax=Galerina marginata (strain CBS 339.88) TaxID=685588 RepID=A0A067TKS7_GALM3|nr:hypothetical protein GALMADRAFT_243667 [Galerina marginata CBS 339.88]
MEDTVTKNVSPIYNLNRDLLWVIFTMNADIFSNMSALPDTRHASQVCQIWREIILDGPSLWGRLIALDHLGQEKDDWRNEVMRRAQNSLLWVHGDVTGNRDDPRPSWTFFISLLANHWNRIQRLVVDVAPVDVNDPRWQAMLQPAPHLETFKVRFLKFRREDGLLFSAISGDRSLFANHAPSLREIDATKISFALRAPWTSNLRTISLSSPFTLPLIFGALKEMPLLEHLNFDSLEPVMGESLSFPRVNLPRLIELKVEGYLHICNTILDHITPGPGCSLSLRATDRSDTTLTDEVLTDTGKPLSQYLTNFYQVHSPKRISLQYVYRDFRFSDNTYPSGQGYPFFIVFIQLTSKATARPGFPRFLKAFISDYFAAVQILDFHVLNIPLLLRPACLSILAAFPSVEAMNTEEYCLKFLVETAAEVFIPHLLPALHTVKLPQISMPLSESDAAMPLINFLNFRKDAGFPIKVLDISKMEVQPLGHFGPILDQDMAGMIVLFKRGKEVKEVVCGSNRVTRLFL